jgi:xeroderma pigmentosum group C-complementing protein
VELSGGGGFMPNKAHQTAERDLDMAGGFLPASQEEDEGLTIDHGEKKEVRAPVVETAYRTPISLTQALQQPPSEPSENPDHNEAMSIDQDTEDEHEGKGNDEDEEYEHAKLESDHGKSTAATSGGRSRGRGRPRGRGTKAPARLTRKPNSTGDEMSNGALSDAASNPPSPPPSRRSAPRRKAARKSDAHVRSHFFAEASEGETDLTDMTDRASPKKKATRGRGAGRGRGRGRGKAGKAK